MWSNFSKIWYPLTWIREMDQQHPSLQTVRTSRHFNHPRHLHTLGVQRKTHRRKNYRLLLLMIYFEYILFKKIILPSSAQQINYLFSYRPITHTTLAVPAYKAGTGNRVIGPKTVFRFTPTWPTPSRIGEGLRCRYFESICSKGQGQQPENNCIVEEKKLSKLSGSVWCYTGWEAVRQCRVSPIHQQYQFRLLSVQSLFRNPKSIQNHSNFSNYFCNISCFLFLLFFSILSFLLSLLLCSSLTGENNFFLWTSNKLCLYFCISLKIWSWFSGIFFCNFFIFFFNLRFWPIDIWLDMSKSHSSRGLFVKNDPNALRGYFVKLSYALTSLSFYLLTLRFTFWIIFLRFNFLSSCLTPS